MYIYVPTVEASVHGLATDLQRIFLKPKNTSLTKINVFSKVYCLKNLKYFA